ncbi:MAG: hypothetical protein RIS25_440 [Actinomycetota bacterium]|jgi:UDP-N-acetylmuramyl tripeptide synthase
MRTLVAVIVGRMVRIVTRLRGGGSALPGWCALKIHPRFLHQVFADLAGRDEIPVIVVTGSNGKSTTTSMIVSALESQGHTVFSNPSGGNLPQGVASAVLADVSLRGRITATAVVLELDEAYGPALVDIIRPSHAVLLNVQVDQLNRFFEPERVIEMVQQIGAAAGVVVVNDSDANTRAIGNILAMQGHEVHGFSVDPDAAPRGVYDAHVGIETLTEPRTPVSVVTAHSVRVASISVSGVDSTIHLPAAGIHYAIDAAAALALVRVVCGTAYNADAAAEAISRSEPVYGRGESVEAFGDDLMIVMMKNHPSLQMNLDALTESPESLYLAVDEGTPDPSWIYDIDLTSLDHVDVVTGTKAWQWETRLAYEEIPVGVVDENPESAFATFGDITSPHRQNFRTAIVNYEQMMDLRRELGYMEIEGDR